MDEQYQSSLGRVSPQTSPLPEPPLPSSPVAEARDLHGRPSEDSETTSTSEEHKDSSSSSLSPLHSPLTSPLPPPSPPTSPVAELNERPTKKRRTWEVFSLDNDDRQRQPSRSTLYSWMQPGNSQLTEGKEAAVNSDLEEEYFSS